MNPKDKLCKDKFIEEGAFLEHKRWANWQEYLHSLCIKNEDGSLTIPKERVERWERQIKATYTELPEEEKEFDRIEVRKYIPILLSAGWVRKSDVIGCKYAVISHGIGISGKVEEYIVHCAMNPENDYTSANPPTK